KWPWTSITFTRRPPIDTSRRFAGAGCRRAPAERLPVAIRPAAAPAAALKKSLRFGMVCLSFGWIVAKSHLDRAVAKRSATEAPGHGVGIRTKRRLDAGGLRSRPDLSRRFAAPRRASVTQ